jgi:hypothetical protein
MNNLILRFRQSLLPVVLVVSLCGLTGSVHAQDATGRVVGTVTDPQGAVIPDADVEVIDTATSITHTTKTDKNGSYQVLALPIGTYRVRVTKEGFKPAETPGQKLQINQSLRIDVALEVGAPNETVQVEEAGAAQVETINPTLGASITSRPIVDMPLNGRNVLDLALLQPGVTDVDNPGNSTFPGAQTPHFSIAGGREDSVTYLLDGGNNNSLLDNDFVFNPNPDAVAEFRVLQSDYTAEYGRNGGGIISVVTKSGTNDFHGSAFDFFRNDALDANLFLNKRNGAPRQDLKRNQFGGTFGGPIVKDKLFFFMAYQGQRQTVLQTPGDTIAGASELQTVPTPLELTGNFSQSGPGGAPDHGVGCFLVGQQASGPFSDCTFTDANGNTQPQIPHPFYQSNAALAAQSIIDPTRLDPIALKYIAGGLIPSSPTGQILSQGLAKQNADELTGKFDVNFTNNDRLQATAGASQNRNTLPFDIFPTVPGYPDTGRTNVRFVNLAYTKILSSTLLNVLRVTFQRQKQSQGEPAGQLPTPAELGFTGVHPDSATGPPDISFSDTGLAFGFSFNGPAVLTNNTFGYSDDVTWTKGNHNWKFGFYFSPYQNNQVFNFIPNGVFTFVGSGGFFTQNVTADFVLGLPTFYQQGPNAPSNIRSKSFAGYGQDEWHANKRLVLTLGLRYEYSSPKYDTQGRTYSIIPGLQSAVFPNAPPGLVFPGDKGAPTGVNFPDKTNFAPRIGFAWDPAGNGKTSIRGGFGIFYDILKAEDNFQFNGTQPFFASTFFNTAPLPGNPTTQPTVFSDPFTYVGLPNPFPSKPVDHNVNFATAGFLPWSPITTVDPHLKTPYIYQFNLSIQRQLANRLSVEADYVGSSAHGLTGLQDVNPFPLVPNPAGRILGPNYFIIDEFRNVGFQSYNGLQLALRKDVGDTRLGQVYFTLGYTLAHNIDNVSGFRQRSSLVPFYNVGQFRGNSDIDIRDRITFSGGWDLPFDRLGGPKKVTKGWSLYPILSYRTGFPLDILNTYQSTFTDPGPSGAGDGGLVRANLVGNSVQILNPKASANFATLQYLDPSCLSTSITPGCNFAYGPTSVPSGYGTLGRNAVPGPSRFNLDMSLSKVTPLFGERVSAEFRAEFFNILNSTQLEIVNTNVSDLAFGQVTQTYPARVGQLALRIRF